MSLNSNNEELTEILNQVKNLPPQEQGGAVNSVNGKTGDVVLTADDINALSKQVFEDFETDFKTFETKIEGELDQKQDTLESYVKTINGKDGDVTISIPEKVSELENDISYATETYVVNKIAEAELAGGDVDLSGYATKDDLLSKVDKKEKHSLVADSEIERLSKVFNYDDTEIKQDISKKASLQDMTNYIEEHKQELKGDKGDQGIQGPEGPQGIQGEQGPKGDKGDQGEAGPQGKQGDPGEDGYTPVKGEDYYTPEDKAELLDELSKALPEGGGVSEWADIKNKPGDIITEEGFIDLVKAVISDMSAEADSMFIFENDAPVVELNVGDKLFACISMNAPTESSYMESEVVDVEGVTVAVFNSSQNPLEIIGSMQFTKNDAALPAFMVIYEKNDDSDNAYILVYMDADYTGYNFTVAIKDTISKFIKLTNDALDLDENPAQYSKKPISSGGTFEAIKDIRESTAEEIKDIRESTAQVFVVTMSIELTPQFIVSGKPSHTFWDIETAHKSGKLVYLKSISGFYIATLVYISPTAALFALEFESSIPGNFNTAFIKIDQYDKVTYTVVSENDGVTSVNGKKGAVTLSAEDIGALPDDTEIPEIPENISAFRNDIGYLTEHQSLEAYAKKEDINKALDEKQDILEHFVESVNGYSGKVSLSASDVKALPDSTVIPTVPTNVSAFTNDADYATNTYVSEVLGGKCKAYVFDYRSKDDENYKKDPDADNKKVLDDWLQVIGNITNLRTGDVFLIRDIGVPDYWWDGDTSSKQILETTKVDLTDYAKTTDIPTKASDIGALSEEDLEGAINEALTIAKTSGQFDGKDGEQGPIGPIGPEGPQGIQGIQGPEGPQGEQGIQGEKGDKGDKGDTGLQGPKGDKGDTGEQGPKGEKGDTGADGADGTSITHEWNGTILSITSASGTSSADLRGPAGPSGSGVSGESKIFRVAATAIPTSQTGGNMTVEDCSFAQIREAYDNGYYIYVVGDLSRLGMNAFVTIPMSIIDFTENYISFTRAIDLSGEPTYLGIYIFEREDLSNFMIRPLTSS